MNRPYTSTQAANVKVGDTIIFDTPRWDVVIEEARPMNENGWIWLTANNDTWSLALKTTDTVRVLQGATAPSARFEKRNGFWVGIIEGCPINITYKREATCRKWTDHYIKNHLSHATK